jgi:hypothetical protein
MKFLACFAVSVSLLLGCSNSGSDGQNVTKQQETVFAELSKVLSPPLPSWDCEDSGPIYEAATKIYDLDTRMKLLMANCVWKMGDTTVKAVVKGKAVGNEVETLLLKLVPTVKAFSSTDVAKMMVTSRMDGVQSTADGVTSWSVNGWLTLIIDIPLLIKATK